MTDYIGTILVAIIAFVLGYVMGKIITKRKYRSVWYGKGYVAGVNYRIRKEEQK